MTLQHHYLLHEDSGSTAVDQEGSKDGTVDGPQQGVAGIANGSAYSFNGSTDVVDLSPVTPLLDFDSDFTIAFWVYDVDTPHHLVDHRNDGYSGPGFQTASDGTVKVGVGDGSAFAGAQSTTSISTAQWYHVAARWFEAQGRVDLFINGQLEDTGTNSNVGDSSASGEAYIGAKSGGTGTPSDHTAGRFTDVRFYDRAVAQSVVQHLYHSVANGSCLTTGRRQL